MDEHNWATNKTECQTSTSKYGQVQQVKSQKQTKSKQTHLFVCPC